MHGPNASDRELGLLAEVQRLQKEREIAQAHGTAIADEYKARWQAAESTVSRLTAEREELKKELEQIEKEIRSCVHFEGVQAEFIGGFMRMADRLARLRGSAE